MDRVTIYKGHKSKDENQPYQKLGDKIKNKTNILNKGETDLRLASDQCCSTRDRSRSQGF